ncbi:metal ABC transporter solute-binding protein, Zn/Mn family, partial [Actinobacillus seminis]
MTDLSKLFKKAALAGVVISFSGMAGATILTSIKPLGFIASSIADGVTDTQVLVPAGASPHDYSLKPSDIQKVKSADLILWIGEDVDAFLEKNISQDVDSAKVLTIAKFSDVTEDMLLKGEHHHHHHGDHDHDHDHDH